MYSADRKWLIEWREAEKSIHTTCSPAGDICISLYSCRNVEAGFPQLFNSHLLQDVYVLGILQHFHICITLLSFCCYHLLFFFSLHEHLCWNCHKGSSAGDLDCILCLFLSLLSLWIFPNTAVLSERWRRCVTSKQKYCTTNPFVFGKEKKKNSMRLYTWPTHMCVNTHIRVVHLFVNSIYVYIWPA